MGGRYGVGGTPRPNPLKLHIPTPEGLLTFGGSLGTLCQ
jgi:hypothetical protein